MNKLYIFCGIPFSGKSTIADLLAKKFGFTKIDLDEIKFQLFGQGIKDDQVDKSGWNKVYKKMYEEIEANLKDGKTVINDTGNFTQNERKQVKQIADKLGIDTIQVFIDTPVDVARRRLLKNRKTGMRFDVSDEDFNATIVEMEPPEGKNVIKYKYPQPVDKWITVNFQG